MFVDIVIEIDVKINNSDPTPDPKPNPTPDPKPNPTPDPKPNPLPVEGN